VAVTETANSPWTRKHDNPAIPTVPLAPRTVYPTSLEDLIEICSTRPPGQGCTAAGSHWSLSTGAVADTAFIETHDPRNVFQAMAKTLVDVVPGCLTDQMVDYLASQQQPVFDAQSVPEPDNPGEYYVHIETGKRVYQLYSELDAGDDQNPRSLAVVLRDEHNNGSYLGPWAFRTLGGAGGQTVFGALTTGTHGGTTGSNPSHSP
jgi:hypothetical protein